MKRLIIGLNNKEKLVTKCYRRPITAYCANNPFHHKLNVAKQILPKEYDKETVVLL